MAGGWIGPGQPAPDGPTAVGADQPTPPPKQVAPDQPLPTAMGADEPIQNGAQQQVTQVGEDIPNSGAAVRAHQTIDGHPIEHTHGLMSRTADFLMGSDEPGNRQPGVLPAIAQGAQDNRDAVNDWATKGPSWTAAGKAVVPNVEASLTRTKAGVQEAYGASEQRTAARTLLGLQTLPQVAARTPGEGYGKTLALAKDPAVAAAAAKLNMKPEDFAADWMLYSRLSPETQADTMARAQREMTSGVQNKGAGRASRYDAAAIEATSKPGSFDRSGEKLDPWSLKGIAFNTATAIPKLATTIAASVGGTAAGGPGGGLAAGAGTAAMVFAPEQYADAQDKIDAQLDAMRSAVTNMRGQGGEDVPKPTVPGNIDLSKRKVLKNPDGSISTESSISIGTDKGEVLIPTVVDGKRLSKADAIAHYKATGQHLGIFASADDADAYAEALHRKQGANYIEAQANELESKRDDIAGTAGMFYAVADAAGATPVSAVITRLPVGKAILDRIIGVSLSKTVGGRIAGGMVANGAGGMLQASLNQAIDAGVIHQNTPLKDALKDIAYTGLIGAISAGPLVGAHEAARGAPREAPNFEGQPDPYEEIRKHMAGGKGEPPVDEGPYPGFKWDEATGKYQPTGKQPAAPGAPQLTGPGGEAAPRAAAPEPGLKPAPGAAQGAEYEGKVKAVNEAAAKATTRGDIQLVPADEGWEIHVGGKAIAQFDTAANARTVLAQARKLVGTATAAAETKGPESETKPPETATAPPASETNRPAGETAERRADVAQRLKVSQMTPEQLKQTLLTHELTGIPNRRAYDESEKKPAQTSADVDSLKWVNDNMGHEAGDNMLKEVAKVLHEESGGNAYHRSGDEFTVQHNDLDAADDVMERAKSRLAKAEFDVTMPDGRKVTLKGIGLSYGNGTNLDEAERYLQEDKSYRQSKGLRSAREGQPPGAVIEPGGAGREDHGDTGATHVLGQEVTPPAEPTEAQQKSGDYSKPTVMWDGDIPLKLENVPGQTRTGTDTNGKPFSQLQKHAYGYFDKVKGKSADGEKLDVRVGNNPDATHVYVIDQLDANARKFDELQPMVGFDSKEAARKAYLDNFPKGWKGLGAITEMPKAAFRTWLEHGSHDRPMAWQKHGEHKDTRFLRMAHQLHERSAQAGWQEVGGKMMRKTENPAHPDFNVITGRTPWVPKHDWFKHVQGGDTRLSGNLEGAATRRVIQKALAGESLGPKEERHVKLIADIIESGKVHLQDLERMSDDELLARASILEQLAKAPEPEGVKEDFKLYGQKTPGPKKAAPKQADMFGSSTDIANELEKVRAEIARRQREAPGPESAQRPDLFNSSQKQVDVEQETKAAAHEEVTLMDLARQAEDGDVTARDVADAVEGMEDAPPALVAAVAKYRQLAHEDFTEHAGRGDVDEYEGELLKALQKAIETPKTPETPAGKEGLVDVGEKIGGARKDLAQRGLTLDDLASMSDSEAATLVKKANVWKPDYEKLIAAGKPPEVAAAIKVLYDGLAATPRANTPVGRTQYIEAMGALTKMFEGAKTIDDLKDLDTKLATTLGYDFRDYRPQNTGPRDTFWSIQKGRRSSLRLSYDAATRIKKMLAAGWPNAEPWKSRLTIRDRYGHGLTEKGMELALARAKEVGTPLTEEQLRGKYFEILDKQRQARGFAASQAEAETLAKSIYETSLKSKGGDGKLLPERPHLDMVKRSGLPERINRDVKAEDFLHDFGFRGVEFGNWAANDERQKILNLAYDALRDLAEILNVPAKALSLNNTMAMAFGARGGGRFAAHYEPGKLVINMTKINGAGALAHEWAHAFDHYFGELDRSDAYKTAARGASGWYSRASADTSLLRPEMSAAWREVMEALFKRDMTKAEHVRAIELNLEKTQADLARDTKRLEHHEAKPLPELPGDLRPHNKYTGEMREWIRRMKGRELFQQEALAKARGEPEKPGSYGKVESSYYKEAQKFGSDYWTRPTEMWARAFEAYIGDRIRSMGAASQYLTHGNEKGLFASPSYKGDPYPNEDRATINAAIDKLVKTLVLRGHELRESRLTYNGADENVVESRKKAYNGGQLTLDFEAHRETAPTDFETRPDTTIEQVAAGRAFLESLIAFRDRRAGATVLANGVTKDFAAKGHSSLIGQRVDTPRDLALLAQVYRDPRIEHLHVIVTRGQEIVGQSRWSSRLPGAVTFGDAMPDTVTKELMSAHNADGYWIVHNHPRGRATPSSADAMLTVRMASLAPGFKGHVVVDHDEYGTIDEQGQSDLYQHEFGGYDPDKNPQVAHQILGKEATGPSQMPGIVKYMTGAPQTGAILMVTDSIGKIKAAAHFPHGILDENSPQAAARIRRMRAVSGSGGYAFIVTDDPPRYMKVLNSGTIADLIDRDGKSHMIYSQPTGFDGWNKWIERGRTINRVGEEDTPEYRAPTFYSALTRAAEGAKREKGTAAEWLGTLKNIPGVKQEELDWSGVKTWLDGQGRVSRDDLVKYLKANELNVGEVMHSAVHTDKIVEEIQSLGYDLEEGTLGDPELFMVAFGDDRDIDRPDNPPPRVMQLFNELNAEDRKRPQYQQYTEPGGKNYRELLVTLPENAGGNFKTSHWETPGVAVHVRFDERSGANGERILHIAEVQSDLHQLGRKKGYWKQDPATDERLRELNKHILRLVHGNEGITEAERARYFTPGNIVQSYGGRDKVIAYHPINEAEELAPTAVEQKRYHDLMSNLYDLHSPVDKAELGRLSEKREAWVKARRSWSVDVIEVKRDGTPVEGARVINHSTSPGEYVLNQYQEERRDLEGDGKAPDAPFKTTWHELALKRMLRYAAEHGYDRLTWDTGATNAERSNQLEQVKIKYSKRPDGNYEMRAMNDVGRIMVDKVMRPEELSELVGKEIAKKIIAGEGREEVPYIKTGEFLRRGRAVEVVQKMHRNGSPVHGSFQVKFENGDVAGDFDSSIEAVREMEGLNHLWEQPTRKVLEGDDMVVGGAGMIAFYDKILPAAMNKLVKPWVTRVTRSTIGKLPVNSVDITTDMRESVMQGQAVFEPRRGYGGGGKGGGVPPPGVPGAEEPPEKGPRARAAYEAARRAVAAIPNNEFTMAFRRILDPANVSTESKATAGLARAQLGELAHDTAESLKQLEAYAKKFDLLSTDDRMAFIDDIETGSKQHNKELQPAADTIRKALDDWRERIRDLGTGALENFIENYFPHIWADPKQARRVFAQAFGRRPLKGSASFLKERTIPTTREGLELGLKPVTTNPLTLAFMKLREMQRFHTGVTLMENLKDAGLAKFLRSGIQLPEGWKAIDDAAGRVKQWSEEEGGFIERGRYIMPEDAARVINNHLSASALSGFLPAQVFRVATNAMNALQLGFSAFHLGFTTLDAVISKNAIAVERLAHGEPLGALRAFLEGATGPGAAAANVVRGARLMKAYSNVSGATPELQAIVRGLIAAGGRTKMDTYFRSAMGESPFRGVSVAGLVQDLRLAMTQPQDRVAAITKTLTSFPLQYATKMWHELQEIGTQFPALVVPLEVAGRVTRASTAWIMEYVVPLQKLGVFSDMASDHIRRNPGQDPVEFAKAMQAIWNSVDNRLGEMVYDNVFWNRTFKDVAHFSVRAVGWNLGTIREIGGAPVDAVKLLDWAAGRIEGPEKRTFGDALGHKIPYVLAMTATTMILGAMLTYLFTGKGPQDDKDYFFPPTGRKTKYGTPERMSMPSYVKDVYEYGQDPFGTLSNKANPIFGTLHSIWSNEDFYGNAIRNPDASGWEQTLQSAMYAARQSEPFALQGTKQFAGGGAPLEAMPYFGFTPAPARVTSPEQMSHYQHQRDEQSYIKGLNQQIRKARDARDFDKVTQLQQELQAARAAMRQTSRGIKQDKAKAKQTADHVTSLIGGKSKTEQVAALQGAGYPALAQLWSVLPTQPRPRVSQALGEFA